MSSNVERRRGGRPQETFTHISGHSSDCIDEVVFGDIDKVGFNINFTSPSPSCRPCHNCNVCQALSCDLSCEPPPQAYSEPPLTPSGGGRTACRKPSVLGEEEDAGIGVCGWLLTSFSMLLVLITLPFSLCVCFKVSSLLSQILSRSYC